MESGDTNGPVITGYRKLSDADIELMNEGKAIAELCGAYVERLRNYPRAVPPIGATVVQGQVGPLDQRWISIGETDIQRGFMALMRGIAQPSTF